jgi:hypothetical protein
MTRFLLALALVGTTAAPAFAMMADSMSCADFTAMEAADQMEAMAPAEGAMGEGEGGMSASGQMAEEDMSPDHMVMEATEACEAHPDMTVGEAMKAGY